eukprot:723185-Prorocentrum_minimum.AAC.1
MFCLLRFCSVYRGFVLFIEVLCVPNRSNRSDSAARFQPGVAKAKSHRYLVPADLPWLVRGPLAPGKLLPSSSGGGEDPQRPFGGGDPR